MESGIDGSEEQTGNTEEEEVTDMSVAWESLETCRRIYEAHAGPDTDLPLADCRMRLGDVKQHDCMLEDAVMEYDACLHILQECCAPEDRRIAEIQHKLGVAWVSHARTQGSEQQAAKHSRGRPTAKRQKHNRKQPNGRSTTESKRQSRFVNALQVAPRLQELL